MENGTFRINSSAFMRYTPTIMFLRRDILSFRKHGWLKLNDAWRVVYKPPTLFNHTDNARLATDTAGSVRTHQLYI